MFCSILTRSLCLNSWKGGGRAIYCNYESFTALDTGKPTPGAGFTRSARRDFSSPLWRVYTLPVLDLAVCQGMLLHTLSCGFTYNSKDPWKCCMESCQCAGRPGLSTGTARREVGAALQV